MISSKEEIDYVDKLCGGWKTIVSDTKLGAGNEATRFTYVSLNEKNNWTHLRINMLPDGAEKITNEKNTKSKIIGLNLSEALKEKCFYILAFSFFSISMLVTALHFFQVTILNEYFNLSSQIATTLFIPTMIAMILFIPIIGKL